jgi:hypothetical protein
MQGAQRTEGFASPVLCNESWSSSMQNRVPHSPRMEQGGHQGCRTLRLLERIVWIPCLHMPHSLCESSMAACCRLQDLFKREACAHRSEAVRCTEEGRRPLRLRLRRTSRLARPDQATRAKYFSLCLLPACLPHSCHRAIHSQYLLPAHEEAHGGKLCCPVCIKIWLQ